MTAKEKRHVRKLEIKIEELEVALKNSDDDRWKAVREHINLLVDPRAAVEALEEAVAMLRPRLGDDKSTEGV